MERSARIALLSALPLAMTLACASMPVSEPAWFTELRAREVGSQAKQRIQSKDRFFRASAPAKSVAPVAQVDDAYHVSLDIGTEAPIDCFVYSDGIDFASSVAQVSERAFESIGQSLGPVQRRAVDRVDAGVLAERPYLAADWMYQVQTAEGPKLGLVKHLVTSKEGRGLYCLHNEVGYHETFRSAVVSLLETLEYASPPVRKPYFSEITIMQLRGKKIGGTYTALSRDGEDTRVDTHTFMLVPVSHDTLRASDSFDVEFARPDGSLINQIHVESEQGRVVSHLELNPAASEGWTVEGTFQEKQLSTRIGGEKAPGSWLSEAYAVRKALEAEFGPESRVELESTRWVPDADPTRLLDATLSIVKRLDQDRFAARLSTLGLEADLVLDRTGSVSAGVLDMGAAKIEFERVHSTGTF